jgi:hypothetical protein
MGSGTAVYSAHVAIAAGAANHFGGLLRRIYSNTHGGHRSSPLRCSPHALLVRLEQQHEELVRQVLRRLVLLPQNLADLLLHLGLHPGIRIGLRPKGRRVVEVVCVIAVVKAHGCPRPCSPVHVG